MRSLRLIQTAILIVVALLCLAISARAQKPDANAVETVNSWNAAVSTLEIEGQNFGELLDSFKRNPPGRVLLTDDVRAAQRKRRLALIAEIIASHEERIRALRRLAKAEEESK